MANKYTQTGSLEAEISLINTRLDRIEDEWEAMKRAFSKFVRANERWRRGCNARLRQAVPTKKERLTRKLS